MNGKKDKITQLGVIQMFTKKQYLVDIYYKMKHRVMHICALLKLLLDDYINLKWLKPFLIIFGMAGYAWLALYYPTQVLIAVYLSAVLALMLRIRFKI